MQVRGAVALVTGANRGIGRAFARALLAAGARKVYGAARDPSTIADPDVSPLPLDITDPDQIAAAMAACGDVSLLVNNAGVAAFEPLIGSPSLEAARREMETNYFGTLAMCRAFAPILKRNGGGAIVNVLSVVSWVNVPMQGSYSASKAAEWSMTNGIRIELRAQGTLVVGVHAGYVDTDMAAHVAGPKTRPEDVAGRTIEAMERGIEEVLVDKRAAEMRALLAADRTAVDAMMEQLWEKRRKPG
jgi:NAD(P)-dependent dehydrogenase (short-subunit alcohol dehydrogenase family)